MKKIKIILIVQWKMLPGYYSILTEKLTFIGSFLEMDIEFWCRRQHILGKYILKKKVRRYFPWQA